MLICLDASVFLKLAVEEDDSEYFREVWADTLTKGTQFAAPTLMLYEIASTLRKKTVRGFLTESEAELTLEYLMMQPVEIVSSLPLHARALRLAAEFNRPNTYDAHYLALAEELDCELWTADKRLYNAVRDRFPLIRLPSQPLSQNEPDENG
ncbi:MAG TPA: type II toxin-antitoxin system VapC family toxin [Dehalococcoidia bacterium]|nr:type II toxin-antitoxin system VapC family toxin [Dehalococcoidia bacterium]